MAIDPCSSRSTQTRLRRVLTERNYISQEMARTKSDIANTVESERAAIERLLADAIANQRSAAKAIVALDDEEIAAPVRDELRLLGERRMALEALALSVDL